MIVAVIDYKIDYELTKTPLGQALESFASIV